MGAVLKFFTLNDISGLGLQCTREGLAMDDKATSLIKPSLTMTLSTYRLFPFAFFATNASCQLVVLDRAASDLTSDLRHWVSVVGTNVLDVLEVVDNPVDEVALY